MHYLYYFTLLGYYMNMLILPTLDVVFREILTFLEDFELR